MNVLAASTPAKQQEDNYFVHSQKGTESDGGKPA